MQFQTILSLQKQSYNLIDYQSKILLIGSCFSENIGNKLSYFKFPSNQNPFGILFHPKAIEKLIIKAINQKKYAEKNIFLHNHQWHCFDAHSLLSSPDKYKLLNTLNAAVKLTNKELKEASHVIITLGTAWVYKWIETDTTVANCHKISQKKFLKEILSVNEITKNLENIVTLIKSINKDTAIIFTVSPVRHLKDGFIENQQSKSHLITAIHQLFNFSTHNNIHYFPSYEIMMDELRDYRFYAEDMIHPNQTAINYIWSKFSKVWISNKAEETMQKVAAIQKGISHKPFNPKSEQHKQFLEKLNFKIKELKDQFPFINF